MAGCGSNGGSSLKSLVYAASLLSLLLVSVDSFTSRTCQISTGLVRVSRSPTILHVSDSKNLDDMTVKDLKDLLRIEGLSVTGLKKELIDRLTEAKSKTSVDYLKSPKVNILKRSITSLTRKTKVSLGDNVSVLIDGTEDDMRIVTPPPSKESRSPALKTSASSTAAKKAPVVDHAVKASVVPVESSRKEKPKPIVKKGKPASYDIDDDDFLSQLMDEGDNIMNGRSSKPQSGNHYSNYLHPI
jgi:SAP domain